MVEAGVIQVTVLYSPGARDVLEWTTALPVGSTVLQALQASGVAVACPQAQWRSTTVGIWGRKAELGRLLRDLDRVEVYRPLRVDPKMARRERFGKQGVGTAGLFASRPAGRG